MSLDAVKNTINFDTNNFGIATAAATAIATNTVFGKWQNFPISKISHHGQTCCEMAREWLYAMDFSQMNGGSLLTGPRWIRQKYNWGPTTWQIHWCEVVRQKSLDCGAQAALAHEVLTVRGVKSYQVQLVQEFSKEATQQWSERWNGEETSVFWINDDLIYHEGCAVEMGEGNEIKLWDASAAWWINPRQFGGYGGLRAVRIFTNANDADEFKWGEHTIFANEWQRI
ncbi:MAG: hypothetical protein M3033_09685 [Acidobacteriota bacterium]|nr:hypothetical protein [Acidobacteriota bacterium]